MVRRFFCRIAYSRCRVQHRQKAPYGRRSRKGSHLASTRRQDTPAYYLDYTGTGNSLNVRHPHVLQLIMDSLRYWVLDLHVDGFRFDLASTLARELHEVDRLSAFFDIIQQDPVVSRVKLIAEPWDVGEGGYQVGNFPPLWSEWTASTEIVAGLLGGWIRRLRIRSRFTGVLPVSLDGLRPTPRELVTAHDASPADLVSSTQANEATARRIRRSRDNRSCNCGTKVRPKFRLNALRASAANFVTTLCSHSELPAVAGMSAYARRAGITTLLPDRICRGSTGRMDDSCSDLLRSDDPPREHPIFRRPVVQGVLAATRRTSPVHTECEEIARGLATGVAKSYLVPERRCMSRRPQPTS